MREYITHALVLQTRPRGSDRAVDLFTLGLGRVEARMVAGRAIISKFSPHCDPLSLLTVRLVKKKRYTLADAITESRFPAMRRSSRALAEGLEALFALRTLVPKEEPDPRLFHEMRRGLSEGRLTVRDVLALIGYDPRAAHCARCHRSSVHIFVPEEGIFFCRTCFAGRGDKVVLNV
jgi:recombinational DNA repair protein (RecF pathway)